MHMVVKPYLKKRDYIRWVLGLLICYFVFTETGIATSLFAFLVLLASELDVIQNRIQDDINSELIKSLELLARKLERNSG